MNKRQRKKSQKTTKNEFQFAVGEKTLEQYHRAFRNTKAKISRVKKNYGIDLSSDIQVPSLESFGSRKEFNEWLRKSESFRNRANLNYQFEKNEFNVSASKKRLNEIDRKVKQSQERAKEEIEKYKDLPFYSGGEKQGTVGLQRPNKTGIYVPNDFDFSTVKSYKRLDEIEQGANNRLDPEHYDKRAERMKENFMTALAESFNSLADDVIDKIAEVPAQHFYQLFLEHDEFDFTNFIYDPEGLMLDNDESELAEIGNVIDRYNRGEIDSSLWHKNFNKS